MKTCCSEWAWNCLFFACLAPALSSPLFNHLQVFQSVYSSFLGTNLLVIRMPRSIVPSLRPLPFISLTWFQGPSLPQMPCPHQLKAFSMTAAKYSHSGCYVLWFAPGILFFNVQHIQNASYQSIRHSPSNIWLIQEKHVYHFSSWKPYKYIMDHFLNLESIKKKIKIANNSSLLLPRELLLRCHSISFQSFFFFIKDCNSLACIERGKEPLRREKKASSTYSRTRLHWRSWVPLWASLPHFCLSQYFLNF